MKMEFKDVNENEISCIIDEDDLTEWDITIEDLFSNGEKARVFIEEIVQKAQEEYDFVMDNVPLAVQISAIGNEQFIFTISKLSRDDGGVMDPGILGRILKDAVMRQLGQEKVIEKKKKKPEKDGKKKNQKNVKEKRTFTLFFDNFSDAVDFSKRVSMAKGIESRLYRDSQGGYCMILKNLKGFSEDMEQILWISGEFAKKIIKKSLTAEYISEHYKVLIKKDAICVLARM